ncbi:hypothetical protein AAFN69_11125 [Streptomyces sp. CAU 1734]
MTATHIIGPAEAPALGDLRTAGPDDCVYIKPEAADRPDFPKLWEAAGVALKRGAFVFVMSRESAL